MLTNALERMEIKGMRAAPKAPVLTHLFFADDSIIFGSAQTQEMYELQTILHKFCKAFGQRINVAKSGLIVGSAIQHNHAQALADILQIKVWTNPGKYLGLPAEWGRSKGNALQWLRERVMTKIEGWKGNLLNQAGKEVLIKVVLQAIPSYAMSIVKFPKRFCNSICTKIAQFWWKQPKKLRGIHWKR